MPETETEFDWSPLGEAWWLEISRSVGATERQAKFAASKFRGTSNTQAARESGYSASNEAALRSTGHRVLRSNIVQRLLAFAAAEGAGGCDGTVDAAEGRRILSTLARGSDPAIRIRAIESLLKMDAAERKNEVALTDKEIIAELLEMSPAYGPVFVADMVFRQNGKLWGLPFLRELAPILAHDFPAAWERYRSALPAAEHRSDFDALASGPIVSLASLIESNKPRTITKVETVEAEVAG